jgi:hypothetical protein
MSGQRGPVLFFFIFLLAEELYPLPRKTGAPKESPGSASEFIDFLFRLRDETFELGRSLLDKQFQMFQ